MTKKFNTKHPDRGRSQYPRRLRDRGLTKAPKLEDVDRLRERQERRAINHGAAVLDAVTEEESS